MACRVAALNMSSTAAFRSKPFILLLALAVAIAGHVFSTSHVKALPRPKAAEQINVAISPEVQIALAGGDPFLASNLAVFRATIVSVQDLNPADYPILAKVQDDASHLNPAQGDNYYVAQGVLPWVGEHSTAMAILERATQARPTDFLPPYFLGFDYMYFEGKFDLSGRSYLEAANRVGGKNRDALLNHAAKFMEKGNNPATAIEFINGLIKSTRNPGLQHFLRGRILRLEGLITLRNAAEAYQQQYHRPPARLDDLVESGILKSLPNDPLGVGYQLDDQGVPQIIFKIKRLGQK
jgi:tetratricopeptide (TPR) repeat protein